MIWYDLSYQLWQHKNTETKIKTKTNYKTMKNVRVKTNESQSKLMKIKFKTIITLHISLHIVPFY